MDVLSYFSPITATSAEDGKPQISFSPSRAGQRISPSSMRSPYAQYQAFADDSPLLQQRIQYSIPYDDDNGFVDPSSPFSSSSLSYGRHDRSRPLRHEASNAAEVRGGEALTPPPWIHNTPLRTTFFPTSGDARRSMGGVGGNRFGTGDRNDDDEGGAQEVFLSPLPASGGPRGRQLPRYHESSSSSVVPPVAAPVTNFYEALEAVRRQTSLTPYRPPPSDSLTGPQSTPPPPSMLQQEAESPTTTRSVLKELRSRFAERYPPSSPPFVGVANSGNSSSSGTAQTETKSIVVGAQDGGTDDDREPEVGSALFRLPREIPPPLATTTTRSSSSLLAEGGRRRALEAAVLKSGRYVKAIQEDIDCASCQFSFGTVWVDQRVAEVRYCPLCGEKVGVWRLI
jgi:hypothetical protein